MRKYFIFSFILFLLCGCTSSITLEKQTFTIELGTDVFANPALYVKNPYSYDLSDAKIVPISQGIQKTNNRFINSTKQYMVPGVYDFQFMKGTTKIPFKIKIKDTKPPVTNENPETIKISSGSAIRWQEYFDASDLSGVSYSSEPIIDTSESGSYNVVVNISDRFGNAVNKNVTVIIR